MDIKTIKKVRNDLGLTQEEFARLLGVTVGTVNRWENGAFSPSKLAISKINSLAKEGKQK